MATLPRVKILCAGFFILVAAQCNAADCDELNSAFYINNWHGDAPKSITVYAIHNAHGNTNSSFDVIDYKPQLSSSSNGQSNSLLLTPKLADLSSLPAKDSYRIVIDGKDEYLLHDIKMSDSARLGCPIRSATINDCELKPFRFIQVDSSCGRAIK